MPGEPAAAAPIDSPTASDSGGIQILARVTRILRALNGSPEGLNMTELGARTGLPRSTVHRLVTALQVEGLVSVASPGGRIRLGPELTRLAMTSRQELRRELLPFLEQLFRSLDETVDLAVLDGDRVLFIDHMTAPHPLRAVSGVGETFPLYCSSPGRILLAELPPPERERLLPARLDALTPNTITDRLAVLEAIEAAAQEGIAVTREEITQGICAAAVAVRDPFGALAAISVAVPTPRFEPREDEIKAALLTAKAEATAALGSAAA